MTITIASRKSKTRELKWHYFDEYDPRCSIPKLFSDKRVSFTACGKDPGNIKRHTEQMSEVTCLKCLKRLNYALDK